MGAAMGSPIVCCPSCPVGLFRVLGSPCQQRVLLWEPGSSFMQQISWGAPGKPQGTGVRHHQALPVRDLGGAPGLCGAAISPGLQAESLLLPPSLPCSVFLGASCLFVQLCLLSSLAAGARDRNPSGRERPWLRARLRGREPPGCGAGLGRAPMGGHPREPHQLLAR